MIPFLLSLTERDLRHQVLEPPSLPLRLKTTGHCLVVEELEDCGLVFGQIDKETHQCQVVGLKHGVQRCTQPVPLTGGSDP